MDRSAKTERNVYAMPHRSMGSGRPWLYAANREGRIVEWLEYGGDTGRTKEQAEDLLWEILDRVDPEPLLTLIRPRPTLADYPPGTVERAAIAFLLAT